MLFDIRVIDTDTQSHAHHSVNAVLATAEKKRKYVPSSIGSPYFISPFCVDSGRPDGTRSSFCDETDC